MIISDLNTLESIDGSAVVGGFFSEGWQGTNVVFNVTASASGHIAQSQGTATATGTGTATEVDNYTATTPSSSYSSGSATSVSSGGGSVHYGW